MLHGIWIAGLGHDALVHAAARLAVERGRVHALHADAGAAGGVDDRAHAVVGPGAHPDHAHAAGAQGFEHGVEAEDQHRYRSRPA